MVSRGLFALSVALAIFVPGIQPAAAQEAGRKAEEVYQNIQVFRGLPADQLDPTMAFMEIALGVHCGYCHTPGNEAADTNPRKEVARQMIRMVRDINNDLFGGRNVVSCANCHRGTTKPSGVLSRGGGQGIPVGISAGARQSEERAVTGQPRTVDQLFERYVAALGGAQALGRITSLTAKGVHTDFQHLDAEPPDHLSRQVPSVSPIELFVKGPDKRMMVAHLRNGDFSNTYNGGSSWVRGGFFGTPGAPRDMRNDELDIAKLENAVLFPNQLKQVVQGMSVTGMATVGDHETYVVTGRMEALPVVKLYFDQRSGLLVSVLYHVESYYCCRAWQILYSDYIFQDGMRVPRRWTVVASRDWFMTYELNEVQLNAAVEDSKFARPEARPAR